MRPQAESQAAVSSGRLPPATGPLASSTSRWPGSGTGAGPRLAARMNPGSRAKQSRPPSSGPSQRSASRPGAIDAGLPAILDHAAVTWRHPLRRAGWELAAASLHGFRAALDELGFTEIQTPKLVSSATESGASVFGVDYFGRRA